MALLMGGVGCVLRRGGIPDRGGGLVRSGIPGRGGIAGRDGVSSGVGCLRQSG
jgi:hypothetical protein